MPTLSVRFYLSKSPAFGCGVAPAHEKAQACFEHNDFGSLCIRHSDFPKSALEPVGFCESLQGYFILDGGDYSYYQFDVKLNVTEMKH